MLKELIERKERLGLLTPRLASYFVLLTSYGQTKCQLCNGFGHHSKQCVCKKLVKNVAIATNHLDVYLKAKRRFDILQTDELEKVVDQRQSFQKAVQEEKIKFKIQKIMPTYDEINNYLQQRTGTANNKQYLIETQKRIENDQRSLDSFKEELQEKERLMNIRSTQLDNFHHNLQRSVSEQNYHISQQQDNSQYQPNIQNTLQQNNVQVFDNQGGQFMEEVQQVENQASNQIQQDTTSNQITHSDYNMQTRSGDKKSKQRQN